MKLRDGVAQRLGIHHRARFCREEHDRAITPVAQRMVRMYRDDHKRDDVEWQRTFLLPGRVDNLIRAREGLAVEPDPGADPSISSISS